MIVFCKLTFDKRVALRRAVSVHKALRKVVDEAPRKSVYAAPRKKMCQAPRKSVYKAPSHCVGGWATNNLCEALSQSPNVKTQSPNVPNVKTKHSHTEQSTLTKHSHTEGVRALCFDMWDSATTRLETFF